MIFFVCLSWLTRAIVMYSTTTEVQFIPRLTKMAVSVEMPSMIPMKNGPRSLQIRSMRLIWEFIAINELDDVCRD